MSSENVSEKRKEKAQEILIKQGYKDLQFLAQGAFSSVFKCKNPGGNLVAAKVAFGSERDINQEIQKSKELEALKPSGWSGLQASAFADWSAALRNRAMDKQEKHYFKYNNVPIWVYSSVTTRYGSNPDLNQKIAIFEAPLVMGDAWDKFVLHQAETGEIDGILQEILKLGRNLAKSLGFLHGKGMVHLDVKPDNLLQVQSKKGGFNYQLTDFATVNEGLQKLKNGDFKVIEVVGTGDYMAPEYSPGKIIKKDQVVKLDIYAAGVTLLALYMKRVLNTDYGKSGMERHIRNLATKYPKDSPSENEIKFFDLIKLLTAEDPKKRPTAAKALSLMQSMKIKS